MRTLSLSIEGSKERANYLRIAAVVRTAIQEGRIRPAEDLPSARSLAESLGVHRHTVMAGLNELVAEGWLIAMERKGYQVNETLPAKFFSPTVGRGPEKNEQVRSWRLARILERPSDPLLAPGIRVSFRSGLPDFRKFPRNELKSHLADALKTFRPEILSYGDPAGHPPLISELKSYLRRVRAIVGREIIVTHGSQEGIFLVAQLLLKPGDSVAVECPGYPPAWEAFRAAGAKLVPIGVDREGLDTESLARAMARNRIRLIYSTPLHQYPTTATLSAPRRLRLYELASRHDVPILEDDYDHEFHYRSQPIAPLASHDPEGRVLYVSTFSKILFPSSRIGFLAVPSGIASPLVGFRAIVSRQNNALVQDAVARWMREGGFERHLRRMRRVYEERLHAMTACLSDGRASGLDLDWTVPDGGMALWLRIGRNADLIAERARKRGVLVAPESMFQLQSRPARNLRLGFANQSPAELRMGLAELFRLLR